MTTTPNQRERSASTTTGLGTQRTFTGPSLQQVAFPLGGIGTGTVSLGGRGNLRDWEIFNRPAKGKDLPFTFFALWTRPTNGQANAWVLERRLLPPFVGSHGLLPSQVAGLPRLAEARFTGAYPLAHIAFDDQHVPLKVELEAFNPFIPLNDRDSGLPVAIFKWRLHNPLAVPVDATVAFSLLNPIGYDGQATLVRGRQHPLFGGNLNQWVQETGFAGLRMTGRPIAADDPRAGSLALISPWPRTTFSVHWERSGWFDDLQSFWDDFRDDGRLPDDPTSDATPGGQTDVGTLGLVVTVPAGGTIELPFILAWHFPNLVNYWNPEPEVHGKRVGNYYTTEFADALEVARYTAANLDRLEAETRLYHDTLFDSTLPAEVLDAASSQASVIRTTTCLRTEDGRFHAFEGCFDNAGCCPMNCTHVWNYEQSLAYLFPALERTMRLTDFGVNTLPSGEQRFRTLLPISSGALWDYLPAADGQMGSILKLYREWLVSGDDDFLRQLWPQAQRALAYAWQFWDPDRDGVMEGEQHNTYDIEFYGPNTMTGAIYLAALRAAEEMARALADEQSAAEYRRIYESGRSRYDCELWNGEYYVQRIRSVDESESQRARYTQRHPPAIRPGEPEPRYQYGPGCLSDQVLGQWFAHVVGLGYVLPEEHVRSALRSIYRHNWRADLSDHHSCQRTYALNDEAGLLLCSWPRGGRPRYPFPYADEVWTGVEYQVAAHLIYEGMVEEGLAVVRGVRARHDGVARNPWDEFECGHHYARAMSSWSLLLALSGYRYNAVARRLGFAPALHPESFRCFFSTGTGWGLYSQQLGARSLACSVELRYGDLALRSVEVALPKGADAPSVNVTGPAGSVTAQASADGSRLTVQLGEELVLLSGQSLSIAVSW